MERFAIVVDSSADLTQEQYDAMHIDGFIPLSFSIDGKEYLSYPDERELTAEELYATLRNTKAVVGTSQPNPGRIEDALEALLRQGKDVLYIAFTSGLSGTCASAQLVAEDLRERYPGQKLFVVDTLCACCGVAALIEPVVKMREAGCSIEDARDWLEENKRRVCHWISVDDLGHLYRGGRLSAAGAVVGTALGIKPIIDLNSEGKLIVRRKAVGRKKALNDLFNCMCEQAEGGMNYSGKCYICHSMMDAEANQLKAMVEGAFPNLDGEVEINPIGTVIGSHTGPGTVALFFFGKDNRTL